MNLLGLFFSSPSLNLSAQDFAILDAYRSLGASPACAADIYTLVQQRLGRDPRLPTVYRVITKLRDLGLLDDVGEAPSHGGRPRRMFQLSSLGRRALDLGDQMLDASGSVGQLCLAN